MQLSTPIEQIRRVLPAYQKRLKKMGIRTVKDLLFYFPNRYDDFSNIIPIKDVKSNETAIIQGKILEIANTRTWKKRMFLTHAIVQDDTGAIKVVWFNQPYLIKNLKKDDTVNLAGKIGVSDNSLFLSNPAYEVTKPGKITSHTGRLVPVYPETEGITSRWMRYIVKLLLPLSENLIDALPQDLRARQNIPEIRFALKNIHFPHSQKAGELSRRRFTFEELFLIQLKVLREKYRLSKERAPQIPVCLDKIKQFVESLPFKLTDAQRKSAWEILRDLEKPMPMNRLLEGDVGSGKTVVATIAALNTVKAKHQVAFMAPTEILAQQHFKEISKLLQPFKCSIALLTGKQDRINSKKLPGEFIEISRQKILERAADGDIDVLIGTHALIQDKVKFGKLGLVVVDEQHRFGVQQRARLVAGRPTRTITRTNADINTTKEKLVFEDLTYQIRKAAFAVRKHLGLGQKETVYQKALAIEFRNLKLSFEQEKDINVIYQGEKIGTYRPDFIIENKVLVELKSLPFIGVTEEKQFWGYLKGSNYRVALLINFGGGDVQIKRLVYDTARCPRESAFSPRESALIPHFLSMTATPIPRTLALTIYGDLDLSLIDEMPKGRKKIITKIVSPASRQNTYEFIRGEVKNGRQAFVICPFIEESEKLQFKAATKEFEKLSKEIFPDLKLGLLHGRMKIKEKEKAMREFKTRKFDVLVATPVVEVGIDVPNATVMMIEGSDRFGLAQLHQFRGRVGRSEHQSYCFLFSDSTAATTNRRLKALIDCENGFELAEKDLQIRGPGDFIGKKQWGMADLAMAGLSDLALVKTTKEEAIIIAKKDPLLKSNPLLRERLEKFQEVVHLE